MFRHRPMISMVRMHYSACLKSTLAGPDTVDTACAKSFKDMPGPRGRYAIPKIGSLFFMKPFGKYTFQTFHELLKSLHDKYGRTFRMELQEPTVVTEDPDSIATVYRNEGRYPSRVPNNIANHYFEKSKTQNGVVLADGEEWHQLRSIAQKYLLKSDSASIYLKPQISVANDLITRMSTMTYIPGEFQNELFQYATESIGVVCFNKRLGFMDPKGQPLTTERTEYLEAIQQLFQLLFKDTVLPLPKAFRKKMYRDFERVANIAYRYGRTQIKEALANVESQRKHGTFNPDDPHLILKLCSNPKTTPGFVNAILSDLLFGATDSTAKNMELFLLCLALNPDKQEKLYAEIFDVVGPKGNEMEAHHMPKMRYFRACMKESFRLHFPLSFGSERILPKDVVIDGYLVPSGTMVFLNSRCVCNNSQYFNSPSEYIPERWLRDVNTNKREQEYPAFGFLPFGFGSRNCLGRRFAEQELWMGVNKIIQNFDVTVSEKDKNYELIYTTFAQVKDPVSFTFTPR